MSTSGQEIAVIAGVGPGLGAALARKFARQGCAVALLARSADSLGALAGELRGTRARALPVPTDLTNAEAVAKAFARVRGELGPVSIVIDTAAVRAEMPDAAKGPLLNPDEMAETYWALTRQKPGAWTFELELRPKGEDFFV
jgi:NADP-dependent 3-hydroxy acid dehydrogenase YdfG